MAISPNISLNIRAPNVRPALDIFENALVSGQNRDIRQAQEGRAAALAPLQLQQAEQGITANQQTINQNRDTQRLTNLHQTGQRLKPFLDSGDTQGAQNFLLNNISQIQSRIEQGSGEDVTESMETLAKLQAGDVQGVLGDINAVSGLVNRSGLTARQREFQTLTEGLGAEDQDIARRIELGLDPRASLSAQERIAGSPDLGEKVVAQLGAEAEAKEGGKLKQQRKHLPSIRSSIKLAEKAATERGEVLTDLARLEAGLPGLTEAVDQLKELSKIATSTIAGGVYDFAVKQTGFGATKGATARDRFAAIISNQILPLLKPTFGGAFSVQEGEKLEASMGDPDASPESKMAQLESFMAQNERNIRAKQIQLSQPQATQEGASQQIQEGQTATGPNGERIVFRSGNWVGL